MSKEQTTKTAPHKKWLDQLTLELRLNDVSGKSIGDALATVEEFLADSGQSPEEAFGTPREYAERLTAEGELSAKKDLRGRITWTAASLVIFLVFSAALTPWFKGGPLLIGGPQLLCLAVMAALVLTLPLYLPYVIRNFWAMVAVPVIGGAAGLLSAVLTPKSADDALLTLSPAPVLLISVGLLIVLSVAGTVMTLRAESDLVISPLDATQAKAQKARWLELITEWLFPILAGVLLGFTALIQSIA